MDDRKHMEMEELRLTPEFTKLTQKQQLFIEAYCARNGSADGNYDAVAATRTAYQCRTPEIARIMSYSMMQNIRIVEVLNRYFKLTPTEEFLKMLDRAIQNKHLTNAQLQALRMKCAIKGFANRLPTLHAPTDKIPDDIRKAARSARKAKKSTPTKAPKPSEPVKTFFAKH